MPLGRGPLVLGLALALTTTACGDVTGSEPAGSDPEGSWEEQRLAAEIGADQAPLIGTAGEDAVVLAVGEDGAILSHLSAGGEEFETGEPLGTDLGFLQLGGVVRLPDGDWFTIGSGGTTEVDGDTRFTFAPVAFRSPDGLTWEQVEVTGFAHPVEANDVEVVDGALVVAGAYRTAADPSMGGFEAHVWTSTDGTTFEQVDLPGVPEPRGYENDSYAGHLAVTGERLLAAGRVGRSATVWSSEDSGGTWQTVSDEDLEKSYDVSGLTAVGDVVLAGIGEGSVTALRSTDGGVSWTPVTGLPAGGETAWAPVWSDRDRFWTLTGVDDMSWSDPEVCYADLDQCGQDPGPQLVTSPDGSEWSAVELPGEPDEITGTSDGRVLVLGVDADGLVVRTLAAGTSPPKAPERSEPEEAELVELREGESPEVGVRYHAPMHVHCGMDWFWFGDATWRRTDDGPDVETGAGDDAPQDWPLVGETLYGYAVLTDADHLEYSDDDEVIATYRRAAGAPGCD